MLCTSSFPGTKRWSMPALCSRTSTCCLSVTKLRSERGYAHHLVSFAWVCLLHFWPCFNVIVLLWLRASTWVEGRDRGSAWPELSTRTPTSSSWWAPQNNDAFKGRNPVWCFLGFFVQILCVLVIFSLLDEHQLTFLYDWFYDMKSCFTSGLWDEELSISSWCCITCWCHRRRRLAITQTSCTKSQLGAILSHTHHTLWSLQWWCVYLPNCKGDVIVNYINYHSAAVVVSDLSIKTRHGKII